MKLKDFIKDLTKEMENNNWQNMSVKFSTSDRDGLDWLSIYPDDDQTVIIDVGSEGE